ncbi:transposase [Streptomyces sp. NBC_01003]|uniref:zinc ribbon domain-containing protein n=1 Tax=Streptomyces sp. NBC_01003 TaxID=2903714 RepID=UPI003865B3D0|nr:transposase [Streptomyces sp. NBC_01003]
MAREIRDGAQLLVRGDVKRLGKIIGRHASNGQRFLTIAQGGLARSPEIVCPARDFGFIALHENLDTTTPAVVSPSRPSPRLPIAVAPRNTSRQRPECGYTSTENRPTQEKFHCVSCGHTTHADTVGVLNVLRAALVRREAAAA